MVKLTTSVLTLFATSGSAADFRALDIGQSCATVQELEVARGSTPMRGHTSGGADIFAFNGRDFDQELFFTYFCIRGELFTGNYSFPIESLEQAGNRYGEVHAKLRSKYGDAFVDFSPWTRHSKLRSDATDASKFSTNWRTPRVHVTLSIMPNQPGEKAGWRVFLVIGPAHPELVSPPSS